MNMEKITGSEPAMPTPVEFDEGGMKDHRIDNSTWHMPGLTIRQHFAAMAQSAIISSTRGWPTADDIKEISKRAVIAADALISELNK